MIVVLDESCDHLKDAVAEFARVEVFYRKGGFLCRSSTAAEELQRKLIDCCLLGRAIYVAPSFAGFTGLLIANQYMNSLIGLVLVDPSHPRQGEESLRILRDVAPSRERERLCALLAGFGTIWEESCREASAVTSLGEIELSVLAGGKFDLSQELPEDIQLRLMQSRHAMLSEYSTLSSKGVFEIVPSAGHNICRDAPESVISAIIRVLNAGLQPGARRRAQMV